MEIVELADWRIEVDPDVNRAYYAEVVPYICDCDHCTNWRALGNGAMPQQVVSFLAALGVDMSKPEDVFEYGPGPEGHLQSGWYYLSGRIIEGPPLPGGHTPASRATRLDSGFSFGLTPGVRGPYPQRPPPEPRVTLEFAWAVPWTLPEPPTCGDPPDEVLQTS